MGDQCVNIAKLVVLSGDESPKDQHLVDTIERMGRVARSQVSAAKESFATRNVALAQDLVRLEGEMDRLNGETLNRAVEVGDDLEVASGRCSWSSSRVA